MTATHIWIAANVGIAFGYYVLALGLFRLLQRFMRINLAMTAGAFWFFLSCSGTHLEMAYHLYMYPAATVQSVDLSTHMLFIHVVQVVAVWTFVAGTLRAVFTMDRTDTLTASRLRAAQQRVEGSP